MHLMEFSATLCAAFLEKVLLICANTSSSCIIYQERTPDRLSRYSIIKE